MHASAWSWVHRKGLDLDPPPTRVVEFGARDVNGSVRSIFCAPGSLWPLYTGVDLEPGPGVDVVADASVWRPERAPDLVVCCGTLEHTSKAEAIVRHVGEILAPGGAFLLSTVTDPWPPHSAIDGGPLRAAEFYRNIALTDLRAWLSWAASGLQLETTSAGDLFALAQKRAA